MLRTAPMTSSTTTTEMRMTGFDFQMRTRYVFGAGCVERIGELANELGGRRALIVTDPGILAAGHGQPVAASLAAAGVESVVFDDVHENPTTADVDRCVDAARAADIDLIIGLGGGSSMDTAKGCALLLANDEPLRAFWHTDKRSAPTLPLIAVPTTAGTGSESQSYALIADQVTHRKMAIGDPMLAVRIAILDPVLTLTQPATVSMCSGLDAISHAVETAVTNCSTPMSRLFSREAFALTAGAMARVLDDPGDLEARAQMQWGASLGGVAIEASMLGAAHASANPITAHYGTVHGHAVGLMLPHVIRLNASDPQVAAAYRSLLAGATDGQALGARRDAHDLAAWIEAMLDRADMPRSLTALGIKPDAIDELANDAADQWTGRFNPLPMDEARFVDLYKQALQ